MNMKLAVIKKGFTMIELLVVMAIIGVLAAVFITNFPGTQKGARDSQRRSDLKQYQTALESYANRNNGFYPSQTAGAGVALSSTVCANLGLTNCPDDPKGTNPYRYQSNGTGSGNPTGTQYVLWARFEKPTTITYFVVCSNGRSREATGGIPPSGGNCP